MNQPPSFALKAAYYCAAELLRDRRRRGQPIPQWLHRHFSALDAQIRMSSSGQEFGCGGERLEPENWITAKEAALMLGCSRRHATRLAADLDGRMIGGRFLFDRRTVADYAEEKCSA
jgi:hypothetical protein